MALKWQKQPGGTELLEEATRKIKNRFWSTEYRDAIGQPFGGWKIGQVAAFTYIHMGICRGKIGRVMIRTDGTPARDRERESNAAGLANLPEPFEARVDPDQAVDSFGDGILEWYEPIEIEILTAAAEVDEDGNARHRRELLTIPPGWAPLEIGSTQPSRTIYHFFDEGNVARWPYGHDWITLFIGLERPFVDASGMLRDRRFPGSTARTGRSPRPRRQQQGVIELPTTAGADGVSGGKPKTARELAEKIHDDLAECKKHGDPTASWYGWVELDDVRALVAAVLAEPLPHSKETSG
jgi:hypothetical protein